MSEFPICSPKILWLSSQKNKRVCGWCSLVWILEWVPIPFSRGSSRPWDWTCISCLAGGFFTAESPEKPRFGNWDAADVTSWESQDQIILDLGGLKVRDWRLWKKRKERLGTQRDTHGKEAKKTEAEAGGMWPQAKECLEAEGTVRGREGRLPRTFRGSNSPADTWTLGFLPPELGGSKPLLLEATRSVTATGDANRALCWLLQPAHPFPPLAAPLLPTRFSSF